MEKIKKGFSDELKRRMVSRRAILQSATVAAATTAADVLAPSSTRGQAKSASATEGGDVIVAASLKENIVETSNGKIRGFNRNGIQTFKGIRYGASAVGANRFMPPQKPTPWSGVRSALFWGLP